MWNCRLFKFLIVGFVVNLAEWKATVTATSSSSSSFPTWTQDTPNKHGLPLTELNVDMQLKTSLPRDLQDDLLFLSHESATLQVNETSAIAKSNDDAPLIESSLLSALLVQHGNGTTGPTTLVNGTTRVGLVKMACNTTDGARKLGATLAALVVQSSSSTPETGLRCTIDFSAWNGTERADLWTEFAASLWLGFYSDIRFRGPGAPKRSTHSVTLVVPEDCAAVAQQGLQQGRILAQAVALSRDVVNAPHNVLNSQSLAQTAIDLARRYRRTLSCRVMSADECESLGMGAFLGVARGSETTARFIHLTYKPKSRKDRKNCKVLGIVGKGLLFDTGGYNIKPGASMTNMKFDCGGAAAVLGAARALAELEPPHVECHILIAACENMINERAMVPGDILIASNKKTIEVLNTDAEGRLTMADALVYADKALECEEILELSTLTGACMAALGTAMAGLFTKDDGMAETLLAVSEACGNKVWRMPMEESYSEELTSKLADLKNIGGRFGGAITAALFLQNFVEKAKFSHVDLAGPVWDYKTSQASGWGARLVTAWVLHHSSSSNNSS